MSAMRNFLKKLESEQITIKVGQGEITKQYTVPRDLLTSRSKWFANALKPEHFIEGQAKEISLPEDSPDVVDAFLFHVYNQNIEFNIDREVDSEARGKELIMAQQIWTFGDKYLLPELQNCAMHRACAVFDDGVWTNLLPVSSLLDCFRSVGEGSSFRLLVADYLVNMLEKDASAVTELILCDGLLLALHSAEKAMYTLPKGDFPRYMKPTKFADVLFVEGKGGEDDGNETTYLGSGWNAPSSYCSSCGFDGAVNHRCKTCRELRCTCDEFDFVLLCDDCEGITDS